MPQQWQQPDSQATMHKKKNMFSKSLFSKAQTSLLRALFELGDTQ